MLPFRFKPCSFQTLCEMTNRKCIDNTSRSIRFCKRAKFSNQSYPISSSYLSESEGKKVCITAYEICRRHKVLYSFGFGHGIPTGGEGTDLAILRLSNTAKQLYIYNRFPSIFSLK